mgnify:CR=1 FL=1
MRKNNSKLKARLVPRFGLRAMLMSILLIAVVLAIASLQQQKHNALAQLKDAENALAQLKTKEAVLSRFQAKEAMLARLDALGASLFYKGNRGDPLLYDMLGERYALDPIRVELYQIPYMRPEEFGDDDAAAIVVLEDLEWLVLMDATKLTDAGLAHLGKLSRLERLDLEGSAVTEAGVEAFRRAYPNVRVYSDFD